MSNNLIIDGNNFVLIAYAVVDKTKSVDEQKTQLYIILSRMIGKLKKSFVDYNYYVVFDTFGGTKFRKEIDPNYKSTRDHSKVDFEVIEATKSVFEDYFIKSISIPESEADDIIFTLCKYLRTQSRQSINTIVSRDKDMIQIVQRGLANNIYDYCKKSMLPIPDYDIVKWKAMVGDSSDNIKGITMCGPKTAEKFLSGELLMNESQTKEYEQALKIIDMRLNPYLERNYNEIVKIIGENEV